MPAAVLAGCGAPDRVAPVVRVGVLDAGFGKPALERSLSAFYGQPVTLEQSGISAGGGGAQASVPIRVNAFQEVSLGAVADWSVAPRTRVSLSGEVGRGHLSLLLPQGLGTRLPEAITVRGRTTFIEVGSALRYSPLDSAPRFYVVGEARVRRTRSTTFVASPVLRAQTLSGTDTHRHLGAGVGWDVGQGGQVEIGVQRIDVGIDTLRSGLSWRF